MRKEAGREGVLEHEWRAQVEPSRIEERLALLSLKGLITKSELAHGLQTLDVHVTYAIAAREKKRATRRLGALGSLPCVRPRELRSAL